jgi:hypothetical protein
VERSAEGDIRRNRYLAAFHRRQYLVTINLDKDDLVTGLGLEAY